MNSQFDFFGEEDLLTFTALVPSAGEEKSDRLVKVSYFPKQCTDRETGQSAVCLIRGVSGSLEESGGYRKIKTPKCSFAD